MATRTVPDLTELFKQAAEIAQQLPESMREAAFNRALDLLVGAPANTTPPPRGSGTRKVMTRTAGSKGTQATGTEESARTELIESIDSTQHPGIHSADSALDRALMVLQIALKDHAVDGLSPSEVATLLTDKFRINTSDTAVRMALGRATNLVNRVPRGKGFIYRIMGPGEEYLAHLVTVPAAPGKAQTIKKKKHRTTAPAPDERTKAIAQVGTGKNKPSKSKTTPGSSAKPRDTSGARRTSGLGPKAAIDELVSAGFFAKGRTGGDVRQHLKTKRGYAIGSPQLGLALLRLVRDGILDRDTNAEGQYEYAKHKA